nr:MAG TPA: hypothetical protein [Caudoviricetes sp.]
MIRLHNPIIFKLLISFSPAILAIRSKRLCYFDYLVRPP